MDTNSPVSAIIKVCLIPSAAHIIQEDSSNSTTKDAIIVCRSECYCIYKLCSKNLWVTIEVPNTKSAKYLSAQGKQWN